jgi:type VI protein secretion system component Hcp
MALTYYLTIDGIDGGSQAEGHEGAFEISGYDFDVSSLITAIAGGGAAQGKTDFSPLTVNLDLGEGLTDLLKIAATGEHVPSIRLEGVTQGEHPQTVYDLKLGNATLNGLHEGSAAGHDSLSFDFSRISLTTTEIDATGKAGESETFSYDIAANKIGATIPDPQTVQDLPAAGTGEPAAPALDPVAPADVADVLGALGIDEVALNPQPLPPGPDDLFADFLGPDEVAFGVSTEVPLFMEDPIVETAAFDLDALDLQLELPAFDFG